MVAFWPGRAVTLGAVMMSAPFFWARPRMIIWNWPSLNRPVSDRMPGATFAFCELRLGLLRIESIQLRVSAASPERRLPVAMFDTFWSEPAGTPGMVV